ncbi:lactonase family protein [Chloroflexi bacterium TSY]|nr:lactonase family protein [Chloroflexi bacterium TSY]
MNLFSRDPVTGRLTFRQQLIDGQVQNDNVINGLDGATDVRVSGDGRFVYVAAQNDHAVSVFQRDLDTGRLTFVQVLKDGQIQSDRVIDGLQGAVAVEVSSDNQYIYVAGFYDDAFAIFHRDETSGLLEFVQVLKNGGSDGAGNSIDGLQGILSMMVSPDNQFVYVVGARDNAVVIFEKDDASGQLRFVQQLKEGADDGAGNAISGLVGASSIAGSPDGKTLYVTSFDADSITLFSRDTNTGVLTYVMTIYDEQILGADRINQLDGAFSVSVGADNRHVYVAAAGDDALTVFTRDVATGLLTLSQTFRDGETDPFGNTIDGLDSAVAVVSSLDGSHVYVAGFDDNAVTLFAALAPDLVVTKTNDVGGSILLGNSWSWTIEVANHGNDDALFPQGAIILRDSLPDSSITGTLAVPRISYETVGIVNATGLINAQDIDCQIQSDDLFCRAATDDVTIMSGGGFQIRFTVAPIVIGTYNNPRADGTCTADPDNILHELNRNNNVCHDTVVVVSPNAPTVTINRSFSQASPTNEPSILFDAVFSKPVTGFTGTDILLSGTAGALSAVVTEVAPNDGTTYQVAVSGMTSSGTVIASVGAGAAHDATNQPNAASTSIDNIVDYDITTLTADIVDIAPDPRNSHAGIVTVLFNKDVVGVDSGDFILRRNGAMIDLDSTLITSLSEDQYTLDLSAVSSLSGNYQLILVSAGADIQDKAGNRLLNDVDESWDVDAVSPTVSLNQASNQSDPVNRGPIHFVALFDEPVTEFDVGAVVVGGDAFEEGTADPNVVITETHPYDGTTYDIAVSGMTKSGTVTVDLLAEAARDAAGNLSLASVSSDNIVTFDTVAVLADIVDIVRDPRNQTVDSVVVIFDQAVTGVDINDFTLSRDGSPVALNKLEVLPISTTEYRIDLSSVTGQDGLYVLTLSKSGSGIRGPIDNSLLGDVQETWLMDQTPPSGEIALADPETQHRFTETIYLIVTFSESIVDFDIDDITLRGSAKPTTTVITERTPFDGTEYELAISGMSQSGTVIVTINRDSIQDLAGNRNRRQLKYTANVEDAPEENPNQETAIFLPLLRR